MPVWFITGTSRGIGLELVRQLAANTSNTVIASCRNPSAASALSQISKIHVVPLEITSEESVQGALEKTKSILGPHGGIDYLINNAGIASWDDVESATPEELRRQFETNVVGTLRVSRAFLPLVQRGERKVIVNVSTVMGSIGADCGTRPASYCIAKTAQNMLTYKLAKQYPELTVFAFNPGWIKTELGGPHAMMEVEPSVTKHIDVYENAKQSTHSGKFIGYDGAEVPW
ncbi:NAD(P)-binding protein [Auricularia subglabra TFB-10046 SS5]|nr:NAD(P)-binding protein [Auricularia subglabra TFB-10046 SS5]